jgi:molybdopterin/thiamine biosynthesis adenylyltransferase
MILERIHQTKSEPLIYKPILYRIKEPNQNEGLMELLRQNPSIRVYDEIYGQLAELIKSLHPSQTLSPESIGTFIEEHLQGQSMDTYGVWVYYPWSSRLVHLLDEEEFICLRTSRNQYKINEAERETLRGKKLGVIGLSVGQTIALTLAMERTAGELRLADFDNLELTNMNRIRTSVHNLGVPKVISAAREIAELDPFIEVKVFTEGATESNLEAFLTEGGHLDILVEECDSLNVKIQSRIFAKKYGIPVVMEMNDRGMLDMERYDLEPDYPMLHGLIPNLDLNTLRNLTTEEKIPILAPMVGGDALSKRMKFSLTQVGKTITAWPQLASSVMLGGGMVTDTCRRILLGELNVSGRYYVDFEQIIK